MEPQANNESGMSRKSFSAGVAITAIIGAKGDMNTQIAIVLVAVFAISVQGFLDWKKAQK